MGPFLLFTCGFVQVVDEGAVKEDEKDFRPWTTNQLNQLVVN